MAVMIKKRIILFCLPVLICFCVAAWSAASAAADSSFNDDAYAENNDGDDVYISNNGTRFRIPRVRDPGERIFDYASILSDGGKEEMRAKIAALQERLDADVIILTSEEVPEDAYYGSETSGKYCRQFYIDNRFREDAFCFLIDLNNRVMWTAGHGRFAEAKYSELADKIYDACLPPAKQGDYNAVADTFLDYIDRVENPVRAIKPTPVSLIVSSVLSLLGIFGLVLNHRGTQPSAGNTPAIKVNRFTRKNHHEHYLGTTVTRIHIPKSTGGKGRGGGFSSGGFSSGGGHFSGGGGKF